MASSNGSGLRPVVYTLVVAFFALLVGDMFVYLSGQVGIEFEPTGDAPSWIVVPGASVRRDGTPSPILEDRLQTALVAARKWPNAKILLSGTSIPGGYSEPDAMQAWMLDSGLAVDRIVLDRSGTDTRATIRHLGAPSGEALVVSQEWHLPRALWCARSADWEARGLASGKRNPDMKTLLREHFVRALYFYHIR